VLLGAGGSTSLAHPLADNYQFAMLVMAGLSVLAAMITVAFVPASKAVAKQPATDPRVHGCAAPVAQSRDGRGLSLARSAT